MGDALRRLCVELAFDGAVVEALVRSRPSWDDPAVATEREQVVRSLRDGYVPNVGSTVAAAPSSAPLLHAYALLSLVPSVRERHRRLGIPAQVTDETLWDIGNQVGLFLGIHGRAGLDKGSWLSHHVNDHLFALGRLQFQRVRFSHEGTPIAPDEPCLAVHVSERGPLTPAAVDTSFARARRFFATHYPNDRVRWFTCTSWLLDPKLAESLAPGSNILGFQQRFQVIHRDETSPSRVFEFLFLRPDLDEVDEPDLADLARATRLQRAVIDLYEAGDRLHQCFGLRPTNGAVTPSR